MSSAASSAVDIARPEDLSRGLQTVHHVCIQRSKEKRLANRSLLLRQFTETLPTGFVPTTRIPPAFGTKDGYRGDKPFAVPLHEARELAALNFVNIQASTVARKAYVTFTGGVGREWRNADNEDREYAELSRRELDMFHARETQVPNIRTLDDDPASGPIPGQDLGNEKIKFVLFSTVDMPANQLNPLLAAAAETCKQWLPNAGDLALLSEAALRPPYYTNASVPATFRAPAAFAGKDAVAIHKLFLELTAPLDGRSALWATQNYAILDEQTAADKRTFLLVSITSDTNGNLINEYQRAEAGVAPIHLAAAEMGMVSLGQAAHLAELRDQAAVFTVEQSAKEAQEYRRLKQERQAKPN